MKHLFGGFIAVLSPNGTYVAQAVTVVAESREEANGLLYSACMKIWPHEQGFSMHSADSIEATFDQLKEAIFALA